MPGIQGVEALLTVLADRCGFQHPGGTFLAAVDVMLEKPAVLQQVQQLLGQFADGFSSISSALASGILLCEVAAAVAAVPVVGVTERPLAAAARSSNISMAMEAVRHLPGLGPLLQHHQQSVLRGERAALTAFLECLYRWEIKLDVPASASQTVTVR
eukprot:gene3074-3353_t